MTARYPRGGTVPLPFGPFVISRPFGLPFALIAAAIAIEPRELPRRRLRTGGDAASVEPTDAQVLLPCLVAAAFALVGLGMIVGGPAFRLGGPGPGF